MSTPNPLTDLQDEQHTHSIQQHKHDNESVMSTSSVFLPATNTPQIPKRRPRKWKRQTRRSTDAFETLRNLADQFESAATTNPKARQLPAKHTTPKSDDSSAATDDSHLVELASQLSYESKNEDSDYSSSDDSSNDLNHDSVPDLFSPPGLPTLDIASIGRINLQASQLSNEFLKDDPNFLSRGMTLQPTLSAHRPPEPQLR